MTTAPRARWRLEIEAVAAGLVSTIVVAGFIILAAHFTGFGDAPDLRWVVLLPSVLSGAIVGEAYLKNRGVKR